MSLSRFAVSVLRCSSALSRNSSRLLISESWPIKQQCVIQPRLVSHSLPSSSRSFSLSARTKGDEELSTFLAEEIEAEKKQRKQAGDGLPKVTGFDIKTEGAEVYFTKKFNDETISIELNVNHSVDADEVSDVQQTGAETSAEAGAMLSRPNFDVIIERGGKKLFFSCTFPSEDVVDSGDSRDDGIEDAFSIVEFSIYEGSEMKENVYSVSGDIMDSCLYDLLMNMLEERGVSGEFADQLVNFCTSYEHSQYIGLLEDLKKFVTK